jgi:hypothetical protein
MANEKRYTLAQLLGQHQEVAQEQRILGSMVSVEVANVLRMVNITDAAFTLDDAVLMVAILKFRLEKVKKALAERDHHRADLENEVAMLEGWIHTINGRMALASAGKEL